MTASPRVALLSNGRLTTVLSEAGGGYAAYRGWQLTRWAPDRVRDAAGAFLYLRDPDSGTAWSLTAQPVLNPLVEHSTAFEPGIATYTSRFDDIELQAEVCVAVDQDVELRRVRIANRGPRTRRLEVTSCMEVSLAAPVADWSHPAFTRLFVQTAEHPATGALLASRRQRSPDDEPLWMVHSLLADCETAAVQCETDRARFIGRGRTYRAPRALDHGVALSGTVGNVLDPVMSVRRSLRVKGGATATVLSLTGAAQSREDVELLAQTFVDIRSADQEFERSREAAAALLTQLDIAEHDWERLPSLTALLLYGRAVHGASVGPVRLSTLAAAGIGGRHPLVLAEPTSSEALEHVLAALRIAEFWRRSGIAVDFLVAASGDAPELEGLQRFARELRGSEGSGVTAVRRAADLPHAALDAARAAARLTEEDFSGAAPAPAGPTAIRVSGTPADRERGTVMHSTNPGSPRDELRYFNGIGGFTPDGAEYVIRIDGADTGSLPPLPWINVIANEQHGFLVTERGAGCTWSVNSRENRLSPWFNDPVSDPHGEAIYVQALDSLEFWSPACGPCPAPAAYTVRHGFGYTSWEHTHDGIAQTLVQFVVRDEPVKISLLRLRNDTSRPRTLRVVTYVEWVLGALAHQTAPFVHTATDPEGSIVFATNLAGDEYGERVAFSSMTARGATSCRHATDRHSFLGQYGAVEAPAWLSDEIPPEAAGTMSPCAVLSAEVTLDPGATTDIVWLLGQEVSEEAARSLVRRYASSEAATTELDRVRRWWRELLGRVTVRTPVPAIDLLVNGWITYQNLSCRMWGRSALYQSGGALGYRDQLQDSSALLYHDPAMTRRQILLHAAQQFEEGDVLHWWHPPSGKGIRTRFSDDLLWLPYVACFYVESTGDYDILDEEAPFLTAPTVEAPDDEIFVYPERSGTAGSLYEHCVRAIERSLAVGGHGLPLIGTGDWNDGMNRVGREGRGESVWLGFFLCSILSDFIPLCERRGDSNRAGRYRAHLASLHRALNDAGWDGEWYRRAYYDDGTPLGSRTSDECRIDAIAQAWSVISRVAPPDRAVSSLDSLQRHLVSERDGLIRLLTPPFDQTPHDPGYIKGYLPGVRENGGQYTHAALWAVRALAELGRSDTAARLLEMLSPCTRGGSEHAIATYMAEPYVIAADVYGAEPHVGRAGWTWYTGSAGWMLRVTLESLLGVRLRGGSHLVVSPTLPLSWPGFELTWSPPGERTSYKVAVRRGANSSATMDGSPLPPDTDGMVAIPVVYDGLRHDVEIVFAADAVVRYQPARVE